MRELIKKAFDMWNKTRWLKCINKECDRYFASVEKSHNQRRLVNGLIDRYNEIWGEDLRTIRGDRDE